LTVRRFGALLVLALALWMSGCGHTIIDCSGPPYDFRITGVAMSTANGLVTYRVDAVTLTSTKAVTLPAVGSEIPVAYGKTATYIDTGDAYTVDIGVNPDGTFESGVRTATTCAGTVHADGSSIDTATTTFSIRAVLFWPLAVVVAIAAITAVSIAVTAIARGRHRRRVADR
jgi:hypothetical protein